MATANSQNKSQGEKWSQLAQNAQKGNKKSYSSLLHQITPLISGTLNKKLANPQWVDDITQEVLISVHKSLHTYDPKMPFTPWVMAITNFRCADFLRTYYARRRDQHTSLENPEYLKKNVTEQPYMAEYKDVEQALQKLPRKQRRAFEMMKIYGYTAKEVADNTGMSISAVKTSVHRTTEKLKELLNDDK